MAKTNQIPIAALVDPGGLKRLDGTGWNRLGYKIAGPISSGLAKGVFAGRVDWDGRAVFVKSHMAGRPSLS